MLGVYNKAWEFQVAYEVQTNCTGSLLCSVNGCDFVWK
jgi:hypothetical protein